MVGIGYSRYVQERNEYPMGYTKTGVIIPAYNLCVLVFELVYPIHSLNIEILLVCMTPTTQY